ncbi:hypothetical protein B0H14DRAFT_3633134 [Mycena olivaceomarginata]|nr:hypothetical protein B0H14DRAFT_3633134 [Mycena olivaceomarginata]
MSQQWHRHCSSDYTSGGLRPIKSAAPSSLPRAIASSINSGTVPARLVWLARDRVAKLVDLSSTQTFAYISLVLTASIITVALKTVAAKKTSDSRELLQRLKTLDLGAEAHVIQFLDAFEHPSPNGVHQVLVTELVHSLDFFRYSEFTPKITRQVVRQAIKGLKLIYNRGIAHGGLHPGNFGLTVLEATELSELDIWENTTAPSLHAICTHWITISIRSLPTSARPWILGTFFSTQRARIPLLLQPRPTLDSTVLPHSIHRQRNPSSRANTPIEYAAPEIAFAQIALNDPDAPWDQWSDIWALAVCIYGLVNSTDLFSPFMSGLSGPVLLDHNMIYYCGEIPYRWREYLSSKPFKKEKGVPGPEHADELWKSKEELLARRVVEDPPG